MCRDKLSGLNFSVRAGALCRPASGTSNTDLQRRFQTSTRRRCSPTELTLFSFRICWLGIITNTFNFANLLDNSADRSSNMVGSTSSFVVVCGPCFGTGQRGENKPCVVCHSEGQLILQGNVSEYFDCPSCQGSGYPGMDIHGLCICCEGIGAVHRLRSARVS